LEFGVFQRAGFVAQEGGTEGFLGQLPHDFTLAYFSKLAGFDEHAQRILGGM
jgi:hypothetical protein